MKKLYEIYLLEKHVKKESWQAFINEINKYSHGFACFKLFVLLDNRSIRYFIETSLNLPVCINRLKEFVFKRADYFKLKNIKVNRIFFAKSNQNILDIHDYFFAKEKGSILAFSLTFKGIFRVGSLYVYHKSQYLRYFIYTLDFLSFFSIDFQINRRLSYKNGTKYLDMNKIIPYLRTKTLSSLLFVDTTFYLQFQSYLNLEDYDFAKHSLILGSSGSGKSKFTASFIKTIAENEEFRTKYKIVVIDPHASLEEDIGGIFDTKVVDFKTVSDSISLFDNTSSDITSTIELFLDLFKSLIADQYNTKLERMLRYTTCLLLYAHSFDFTHLRKVLLELEYRNTLLKKLEDDLPESVVNFFLTDFNDLKAKSYMESISPILSFIDEVNLLPVFNAKGDFKNLKDMMENHFLTLFSLDVTKLGMKMTKTLSLLVMQQLLTFIQTYPDYSILFIIDEIAVVEDPILSRYLSESRKYHLSLILIGQYLSQIDEKIRKSIFANVINYYIFRVSQMDSLLLNDNLNMKLLYDDTKEKRVKLLSELNNRELVVRLSIKDTLYPAFKCRSMPFLSIPRKKEFFQDERKIKQLENSKKKLTFLIDQDIKLRDILIKNSTSRKDLVNDE